MAPAGGADEGVPLGPRLRDLFHAHGAAQDSELLLPLQVVPLDLSEFDDRLRHHSYLSASTGSSVAARHAGNSVAMNDSTSAMMTNTTVFEASG